MDIVMFHSSATAIKDGMVFSAPTVSISEFNLGDEFHIIFFIQYTAICREDCHPTRGYCEAPNECRCRLGWAGPTCKECQVLPGKNSTIL